MNDKIEKCLLFCMAVLLCTYIYFNTEFTKCSDRHGTNLCHKDGLNSAGIAIKDDGSISYACMNASHTIIEPSERLDDNKVCSVKGLSKYFWIRLPL